MTLDVFSALANPTAAIFTSVSHSDKLVSVRSPHHNKREKVSSLLFDLAKYLLTVISIGAILPESKISLGTAFIGLLLALGLVIVALLITPEERQ